MQKWVDWVEVEGGRWLSWTDLVSWHSSRWDMKIPVKNPAQLHHHIMIKMTSDCWSSYEKCFF